MPRVNRGGKATVRGKIRRKSKTPVKAGENHGYGHGGIFTAKVAQISNLIKEQKNQKK